MSTSPAIMIMANTQAANAAQDALRHSCEASVKGYEHNSATAAQMIDYSKCIQLLHPVDADAFILVMKACVLLVLLGAVVGVFIERDKVIGAGIGALGGMTLAITIMAIAFLFS